MKRTPVNPWAWSLNFGYNQAEIIEGVSRQIFCAGQTAVDSEGTPQHAGDMRKQMELALENLLAVLKAADMALENVTKLNIYTTSVSETMQHFDIIGKQLGMSGVKPPMTLVGVTELAVPGLEFEIEATAAD